MGKLFSNSHRQREKLQDHYIVRKPDGGSHVGFNHEAVLLTRPLDHWAMSPVTEIQPIRGCPPKGARAPLPNTIVPQTSSRL